MGTFGATWRRFTRTPITCTRISWWICVRHPRIRSRALERPGGRLSHLGKRLRFLDLPPRSAKSLHRCPAGAPETPRTPCPPSLRGCHCVPSAPRTPGRDEPQLSGLSATHKSADAETLTAATRGFQMIAHRARSQRKLPDRAQWTALDRSFCPRKSKRSALEKDLRATKRWARRRAKSA
jgi:hypothetical protein